MILKIKEYYAMIIDMSNDEILMFYSDNRADSFIAIFNCKESMVSFEYLENNKKIEKKGCEKFKLMDEMFNKAVDYGFKNIKDFILE